MFRDLAGVFSHREHVDPLTWAQANCYLSGVTEMPGYYSIDLFPYVARWLDCIADPRVTKISLKCGSQTTKTTTMYIGLAYMLAQRPAPALWVMPSASKAAEFSRRRWRPLWESSPELRSMIPKTGSGGIDYDSFATTSQTINGASMRFVGAGADSNIKSDPVAYLMLDEIDEISQSTRLQALERVKGRHRYKIIQASTPTTEHGGIEDEYLLGSQEVYHAECPQCGKPVPLYWRDPQSREYLIKHDQDAVRDGYIDHALLASSAYYQMPCCGYHLRDADKYRALKNGLNHHNKGWLATNKHAEPGHVSFHLPSQYSNIVTFGKMLTEFYKHLANPESLPAFVMGWLAEPWREKIIDAMPDRLIHCEADYHRGEIKGDVRVLMVDVQHTDLRWNVRGYDQQGSYLLDHGACAEWSFVEQQSAKYGCVRVGVDYAYPERKQEVFEIVHRHRDAGWFALRAFENIGHPYEVKRVDPFVGTRRQGKAKINGITVVHIDTNIWKGETSKRRNGEDPSWKVYRNVDAEYQKELFAEYQKEHEDGRGRKTLKWHVKSHRQNHQFDLETYHLAVAAWLGLGSRRAPQDAALTMAKAAITKPEPTPEPLTKAALVEQSADQPPQEIVRPRIVTSASKRFDVAQNFVLKR
jgi:phage terminase large subunit GpA-like protein